MFGNHGGGGGNQGAGLMGSQFNNAPAGGSYEPVDTGAGVGGFGPPGGMPQQGLQPQQAGFGGQPGYGAQNAPGGYPGMGNGPSGMGQMQMQSTTSMHLVFFTASAAVVALACISGLTLLCTGQLVDSLENVYIMSFGLVLAMNDTPFFRTIKAITDFKVATAKYVNIVTRVTGKGGIFLFLGTTLTSSVWANVTNSFLLFVAFVLSVFVTLVGIGGLVIGIMKSQKLLKAQRNLVHTLDTCYSTHARTSPGKQGLMTMSEFNMMTSENGGLRWDESDLKLIVNALSSNPAWRSAGQQNEGIIEGLTYNDLMQWVHGGIVWL